MNEIRAFVGHSFTDDDAAVVSKFLKFFDTLKASPLNFSWQSAEAAEPKILAAKVLSLLADKNLFIAICTRKERVIQDDCLTRMVFSRRFLKVPEEKVLWKTSDWIIQEIGLALGRNLDLILLLEDGVRGPGGLQSNIEYIPFDRAHPDKSFTKIIEMISALLPKTSGPTTAAPESTSKPAGQKPPEPITDDISWKTPRPGWKRKEYEMAFFHEILFDDVAGATINEAYMASEDAALTDNRDTWEAYCEYTRLRFSKGGSLAKLRALAIARPRSSGTLAYLARGFEYYEKHLDAANAYEDAASNAADETEKQHLMGRAAVAQLKGGLPDLAFATAKRLKARVKSNGKAEIPLLKILRELTEIAKENEVSLALMERIVELDPADIGTRFDLAFKHSESGGHDLALFHYLKIPHRERNPSTWNNLGVAFEHFMLHAKAVRAYRRAEEKDETLAMSNLANKLLRAGFVPEAQSLCDKALQIENYHKEVGGALVRLKNIPDEEDEKEAKLLQNVTAKSDFYQQFGRAVTRSEPGEFAEHWIGPDCTLEVTVAEQTFVARGAYESRNTLPGLLSRP
jgi:hypothetical protein